MQSRGRYFEDFKVGEMLVTGRRTVEGGDVSRFAGLTGDFNPLHTDEAARIFASYGLAMEYPVQRYFRDARFLLPGGGTSEILRLVISRELDWDRWSAFA